MKFFLKHQANWNTVCGVMWDQPWHNIWLADSDKRVKVLNKDLSLVVGHYVPQYQPGSSMCITRISLGLVSNAACRHTFGLKPSSMRLIFGGLVIANGLTGKSLSIVKW